MQSFSSCPILFISFYILVIFSSISDGIVTLPPNVTVPAVIIFGDSIVDQGNNNNLSTLVKCNYPPYGKDFLGGTPTGRFTNGKTPADLVAEELGIKEIVPAYLDPNLNPKDLPTGVSFASGGTGYDPQTSRLVSVVPLLQQVEYFKEYIGKLKGMVGEEKTKYILANSIVLVVAGSDDLANTYFTIGLRKMQYDVNSYSDFLAQSASDVVKDLYDLGARRIGVFSVPPIGCLPSQRTLAGGGPSGCAENYNMAVQMYNTKLYTALSSFNTTLNDPKARIVFVDVYSPLLDIIQNHDKYGFSIVDRGCCGTGTIEVSMLCNKYSRTCQNDTKYFFWDSFHPTEQGYRVLVGEILERYIDDFFG